MLTIDLHPYQAPAVEMLLVRQNLLIAMDMGLGKTVTTIAAAEHLLGQGEVSTVLICAPTGLLHQWAQAIAACTDVDTRLRKVKAKSITVPTDQWCVVIDGSPEKKRRQIEQIKASPPQYVIASYDTVAGYVPLFRRLAQMAVIDEVTVLKGFKAGRSKALCGLTVPWRVGLTGTPVENNKPEEAWGIMRWIDPELFGDFRTFDRAYIRRNRFGRPVAYVNLDTLHWKLATAMYRKRTVDPDVASFLPSVKRATWRVNLPATLDVVYRRILVDLREELAKLGAGAEWDVEAYYTGTDDGGSGAGRVGAIQLAAQMLLDHPDLLRASGVNYGQAQKSGLKSRSGSAYAAALLAEGVLDGVTSTPKLDMLSHRVTEILDGDPKSKAIIVTRFRSMIPHIVDRFPGVRNVSFTGEMNRAAKAEAVAVFESDPEVRLMIMTHAGAYGVDLPSASHLINYDAARSSGQRRQIDARHVRVSSRHRQVNVVDMVIPGTIEEWAHDLLDLKDRVASAVTDGDRTGAAGVLRHSLKPLTRHVADFLGDSS